MFDRRAYNIEYKKEHRSEMNEYNRKWFQEHPEQTQATKLRCLLKKKGLPSDWYILTLAKQNGGCAICGVTSNGKSRFCIDHDHRCCKDGCAKCVRGLLCNSCNTALERLESVVAWYAKALFYLGLKDYTNQG